MMTYRSKKRCGAWELPLSYGDWSTQQDLRYDVTPSHMDTIYKRRKEYKQYVTGFKRS